MSITVGALISLRSQVISGFIEGGITEEAYRADLEALFVRWISAITAAFETYSYIELTRTALIFHV